MIDSVRSKQLYFHSCPTSHRSPSPDSPSKISQSQLSRQSVQNMNSNHLLKYVVIESRASYSCIFIYGLGNRYWWYMKPAFNPPYQKDSGTLNSFSQMPLLS